MNKIDLQHDINDGMSSHQIAKKYGKGQGTITYWLKKYGLKTVFKSIKEGYKSPDSQRFDINGSIYEKINWNECQNLHNNGMVWNDLIERGFPHNGLVWAIKNKRIKMKSSSESRKLCHQNGKYNYASHKTEEFRKKMSKFGGYKEGAGRCSHLIYTKKDGSKTTLQGTWEYKFAEFLDKKNIQWEKNRVGYKYNFDNKILLYFPDFWLKDLNLYVEVKGYETEKDKEKWKQFPFKLFVVKKQEIKDLEFWFKNNLGLKL